MCILRKYIHPVVVGLQASLRDFYTGHQKFKQLSEQNQVKILLPGKYLLFFFFLSHKTTPMSWNIGYCGSESMVDMILTFLVGIMGIRTPLWRDSSAYDSVPKEGFQTGAKPHKRGQKEILIM